MLRIQPLGRLLVAAGILVVRASAARAALAKEEVEEMILGTRQVKEARA